jgi:hypothetical protein
MVQVSNSIEREKAGERGRRRKRGNDEDSAGKSKDYGHEEMETPAEEVPTHGKKHIAGRKKGGPTRIRNSSMDGKVRMMWTSRAVSVE